MPLFPYKAEEETDLPKPVKTNAMRILESMGIPFEHYTYECEEFVDGLQIAEMLVMPTYQATGTIVSRK